MTLSAEGQDAVLGAWLVLRILAGITPVDYDPNPEDHTHMSYKNYALIASGVAKLLVETLDGDA